MRVTVQSPVIAQVREHIVQQAGDQRHRLLLLVASVNHVQERSQDLKEKAVKKTDF